MKCIFETEMLPHDREGPWIVYSAIALIVIFPLHSKRVCVSCIRFYIIFFSWNILLFSVDIIHWNWKIYISFSWVGFWFVLDLECMSDPCSFESFLAWGDSYFLLHAYFSVLGRKDWFFISLFVSKRSFSFLSLLLYSQVCWMIFFLFWAWLFEIIDLTFIKKIIYVFNFACIRASFFWKR